MSTSLLVLKAIGPALAQALLKAFDVQPKLANAIEPKTMATATRDLLKPVGPNRQAWGQVEAMAQQMARDIRPLFEGQNRQVCIASRDSILFGLAQTLFEASLTQTGLAEMNFDGEKLEQYLLQANPGVDRDFSAAEQVVYGQAVKMASQRLIAAAPTVAGYEQAKTTELLQRLAAISDQLGLERDLAVQSADKFVQRYRDVVQDELDRLEVFGLPRMDRLTSQQSLSMAYITLSASGVVREDDGDHISALKSRHPGMGEEGNGQGFKRTLDQVDQAMANCRRLVIRGGAGAGKSTLMQWLAVRAASMKFEQNLATWNIKIPFFIRLRNLVGQNFPTPEKFPALVAENIAAQMPANWVHQYLERGQALVLIDGVDELPRQDREVFFKALKTLVRDFPQATYIVTSRPSGLKSEEGGEWEAWEAWVDNQKFKNLTLEPMTAANVETFVTRWHSALSQAQSGNAFLSNLLLNLNQGPEHIGEKLNRQLQQRPELMRLASTPLLCAMICALHLERLENLPSERLALYEACIDMLLNKRDAGRKISLDQSYPIGLSESQKLKLLQSLALKLMRANLSSLEIGRVDEHFGRELKKKSLPEAVTGEQIRALFVDRAALLREPIVGKVDFAHRTFQEYLAAKAVLDEDALEELLQKASDDQWREAIIAAAGLARPAEQARLLQHLVDQGNGNVASKARAKLKALISGEKDDSEVKNKKYLHLLAVACLETATDVEPKIRRYVLDCAQASMPPGDDDEVAMVVRAGNGVVPLLHYRAGYAAEDAIRCIQALVEVGTRDAMAALVDYAKQTFKDGAFGSVAYALGRGWDVFNHDAYLAQVLSHTTRLDLRQTEVSDVSALSALSQLSSLNLRQTEVSDVSALSALSQLSDLNLSQTEVSDVSALSALSQLRYLNLSQTEVSDVSALSALSQLSDLDLRQTEVSDVSALSALSQLSSLDLRQTEVSDVSALSALSQLSDLDLRQTEVSDVSALSALSQLRYLNLSQTEVSDVSALSALSQLRYLNLSQTEVSDVSALSALSQLSSLDLRQTEVSDVSALSALSQLSSLDLRQTEVSDVSALSALSQLSSLNLRQTEVSDVSALSALSQLSSLNLRQTEVSDVSALSALSQLSSLNLRQTEVSDVSALKCLKKLTIFTDDAHKANQWRSEGLNVNLQQND